MISTKMNESFYRIQGTPEELQPIIKRLTLKDPNAFFDPMMKRGLKPDTVVFYAKQGNDLIIPSGLVQFLEPFGVKYDYIPIFTMEDINRHIKEFNDTLDFDMYDYQEDAIRDSLYKRQQLCLAATGAGKSVIIGGICEFLRKKNLKGLVLVPSISLTTQLHEDLKDYKLQELYDITRLIGGDNNIKLLDKPLSIGTWQSVMKIEDLSGLDYIIIDEAHGLKLDNKSTDIVYKSNAKLRIGLTGTLPDDAINKLAVLSCTGAPVRYIRTQGLIERGLATPVHINAIRLRYSNEDQSLFKYVGNYPKRLKFVKEHQNRNALVSKLSNSISNVGNTVVMCSHVQHMKDIFIELIRLKDPTVTITEKDMTGKNAFEFQQKYDVYYIAGATKQKDRVKIIDILKGHSNTVLVSNYQLLSTGINIKNLKNIVFASPLKSYTTITQSIGRAIRLHVSKNVAEIYDFVDDFSVRGKSGPFYKQYEERLLKSYQSEGFPVTERMMNI